MPQDPVAVSGNARAGVASDPNTGAAIVIGGVEGYKVKNKFFRKPRLWLSAGGAWTRVVLPGSGSQTDDYLNAVTPGQVAVGVANGQAAIWEPNGSGGWSLILLGPGEVSDINSAGTLAVGYQGGSPAAVYWEKVSGVWTPRSLPIACQRARAVDDLGRIAVACPTGNGSTLKAAVIAPPYTAADVIFLGGFGDSNLSNVEGMSIRGSWIVGSASDRIQHGGYTGAYWKIF